MAHNFPYLKDSAFLKEFDKIKIKEQFVKIIVLNFNEEPIQEIQGKVISGNISLDGSSAMRRTCNISLISDEYKNDLTTTKSLLSINKKVEVLIGFTNTTNQYTNYDMLWFPQGIYVIINPNISHGNNGINISLTLHDKMALLNGECGGVLPASVIFDRIEDLDEEGNITVTQPTIHQIIQQLVHHFGGEQLGKILISDVDNRIKKVMQWTGSTPLYVWQGNGVADASNQFSTNYDELASYVTSGGGNLQDIKVFPYGKDVGYIFADFVYPTDLISNAGDTIVTILDQIKSVLGNYEYFYDINGNFRFQQIKNYLNTTFSSTQLRNSTMQDYLVDYTTGKSVYTFEDADLITSYTNSPQYQQIKNDFMVWGKRTNVYGKDIPIRYHLAIDKKPQIGNTYQVFFYTDPNDEITKAKKPIVYTNRNAFPQIGQTGLYYLANNTGVIYKWEEKAKIYTQVPYTIESITTTDFRTELYMAGVENEPFGLDSNYYFTELKNEWPKLYNIREGDFKEQVIAQPSDIDFFLDFIDTPTALSEFSVQNIGRRTTVISDDAINCIFEPSHPDLVVIQTGTQYTNDLRTECELKNQEYVQVRSEIYSLLLTGGSLRSAYEEVRKELYQYTNYNEQVSLTALPIYYLEPNTRITIRDSQSGIYGDYMIKSISLPLDINGTMNISCTKAFERI